MSVPKRIQRRRSKGWRMPAGAVYVGRPTMWGNPFAIDGITLDDSITLYRDMAQGMWSPGLGNKRGWSDDLFNTVHETQLAWSKRIGDHPLHMIRATLAGHDLACWCPLDQACHADVLLELANR